MKYVLLIFTLFFATPYAMAQPHSVAREWNEVLLEAIRSDFARPVVHARNLFHTSAGMYDCWSAINQSGTPFFLGRTINGTSFSFDPSELYDYPDKQAATEAAISYLNYHLLRHRFAFSPGRDLVYDLIDDLMAAKGYTTSLANGPDTENYRLENPAFLGNYLAKRIITFGLNDGSNEAFDYINRRYEPVNLPLPVNSFGSQGINQPDRWQPLSFERFLDQSGQQLANTPEFLGAEWGKVKPFALTTEDLTIHRRPGEDLDWWVYHDPGPPPSFYDAPENGNRWFHWNFELVVKWSSHLDPTDGVNWDISPASLGNIGAENYPRTFAEYPNFYDELEGGDPSRGHAVNPATGQPYAPNIVPRGDYTRVLAEFWADGPASETPPGHWFVIMNEKVLDHPDLVRKFKGEGEVLSPLEYDIKAYFLLGGTMHDAAISAWGIKGYYDYVRPLSAIRYLASLGQRSDMSLNLPEFNDLGIDLTPGFIEAFSNPDDVYDNNTTGFLKFRSWRGNRYLENFGGAFAGVDWINAGWWEPYQRPTFVTPNFAGYISGHSTFSSAAAQVLEQFTGDRYFPGGLAEFLAPQNDFLVFEQGPSVDVRLQWATYRDASDQTSLSRIWGGIHPPVDDVPGRLIGIEVGNDAFALVDQLFSGQQVFCADPALVTTVVPTPVQNPIRQGQPLNFTLNCSDTDQFTVEVYDALGRKITQTTLIGETGSFATATWPVGVYFLRVAQGGKGSVGVVQVY